MLDIYLTINLFIMKSTIKIDFDVVTKEPFIEVKLFKTDDLRDRFIQDFFDLQGYTSNLLYVERVGHLGLDEANSPFQYKIRAIKGDATLLMKGKDKGAHYVEPMYEQIEQ